MKADDSHEKLDEDKNFCLQLLALCREAMGSNGSMWADIQFEWGPERFYPRPRMRLSVKRGLEDGRVVSTVLDSEKQKQSD